MPYYNLTLIDTTARPTTWQATYDDLDHLRRDVISRVDRAWPTTIYQRLFAYDIDASAGIELEVRRDASTFTAYLIDPALGDQPYCLSVFLCDRAYGGPEEGGWWYSTGEPTSVAGVPTRRWFATEDEAHQAEVELQRYLDDDINADRPDIDSVLSEGIYRAMVTIGEPTAYPAERPRYE